MEQSQYVCTLCNIDFSVESHADARCPRCLCLTGVVRTDEADRSAGPSRRVQSRRLRLAVLGLVTAVALAVGVYLVATLLAGAGPYRTLLEAGRAKDLPVPWADFESWGPSCAVTSFSGLANGAGQAGFSPLAAEPRPEEILTGAELIGRGGGAITGVEGAGFLLGCALASKITVTPCRKKGQGLTVPLISREYAVCLTEERVVTAVAPPFGEAVEPDQWEAMEPAHFLAHFLGAAGETAVDPREAYRLFGAALGFKEEPALYFSRGLVKVRNGVVEFGVDDMRKAVSEGTDAEALVIMGGVLLERGKAGEALQEFSRANTLDRKNVAARFGLARARLATGAAHKELGILDELVAEGADVPNLRPTLAHVYLYLAQHGEAADESIRLLEEGLTRVPEELKLYLALYMLYQWHDQGARAEQVKTRAYDYFGEEERDELVKLFSELHGRVERARAGRKRAVDE